MKIITYATASQPASQLGRFENDRIIPLNMSPQDFYAQGIDALGQLMLSDASPVPLTEIVYRPVVPAPSKILCVGLNYQPHAEESGFAVPSEPVIFGKFSNALCAHAQPIPIESSWSQVDYELELAVVIGRTTRHVQPDTALDSVLGYCCSNDLSERGWQFRNTQWLMGKSLDNFFPLGPYLVTADEIPDPQTLTVRGWLNGELRQESHTSRMIFSVATIIAYVSQVMTLYAGDIISTGTPEGVVFGMKEKTYMKAGDTYRIEIEKLGVLENQLVEAQS